MIYRKAHFVASVHRLDVQVLDFCSLFAPEGAYTNVQAHVHRRARAMYLSLTRLV